MEAWMERGKRLYDAFSEISVDELERMLIASETRSEEHTSELQSR